jgi:hypothetical protein
MLGEEFAFHRTEAKQTWTMEKQACEAAPTSIMALRWFHYSITGSLDRLCSVIGTPPGSYFSG